MKKITNPKFEIEKSKKDGKFYWILSAGKAGKIVLRSVRGFATKQNAQKNIAYVIERGTNRDNYIVDTVNQEGTGYYYVLMGKNENLAISGNGKNYKSVTWQVAEMGVEKGIAACIRDIPVAAKKSF